MISKKITFGVPTVVQWVNNPTCFCGVASSIPSQAQGVRDLVLLQLWHRSQMQLGFYP